MFNSFDEITVKALFVLQFYNSRIDISQLKINPQYLEEISEIFDEIKKNEPNFKPMQIDEFNIDQLVTHQNEKEQVESKS